MLGTALLIQTETHTHTHTYFIHLPPTLHNLSKSEHRCIAATMNSETRGVRETKRIQTINVIQFCLYNFVSTEQTIIL